MQVETMPEMDNIKVVNKHLKFPKVKLIPPKTTGFSLIALEVDYKGPFFLTESKNKKELIKSLKSLLADIRKQDYVKETALFKARIIPPGRRKYLKNQKKDNLANYDVVVLIETTDRLSLEALKNSATFKEMKEVATSKSTKQYMVDADNIRRIGDVGDVNHDKQGVFLFNFFQIQNIEQTLGIWEYTAGWFQTVTSLDNSTLLQPVSPNGNGYGVINHCRWDKMRDIVPSLVFNKTLKPYVLENFQANNTVSMPILYKLA